MTMKRFTLYMMLLAFGSAYAQDKVVKASGDTIDVKVTKIDDTSIFYKFDGEDLEYQIAKDNVSEITFQSGRKETYSSTIATKTQSNIEEKAEETVINNVFTVENRDMVVDNKIFIYNLTGKELQISVHGTNYRTGYPDMIDHTTLSNKQDKKRLASKVKRGHLDHYTSFTFTIDSGRQKKFFSTIVDNDLFVYVWEAEYIYDLPLDGIANYGITVENTSKRPLFFRINAIDENDHIILSKETNGLYLINPTWNKTFPIKGEFVKVQIMTFQPFVIESSIDPWSRCKIKACDEPETKEEVVKEEPQE